MAKKQEGLFLFSEVEEFTADLNDEQMGQLVRAAFAYRRRGTEYTGADPLVRMAFRMVSSQIDRAADVSRRRQEAAASRWHSEKESASPEEPAQLQSDASGCKEEQSAANALQTDAPIQSYPVHTNPVQSFPVHTDPNQTDPQNSSLPAGRKAPYGKFGWVKLSREEYTALEKELGAQERDRCIDYLDTMAQGNGNKNGYSDWYLIISRCSREHWGRRRDTAQKTPYGSTGLGSAELAAIRRVLQEPVPE